MVMSLDDGRQQVQPHRLILQKSPLSPTCKLLVSAVLQATGKIESHETARKSPTSISCFPIPHRSVPSYGPREKNT
ncbi:hypothetical protein VTN77DRAFT_3016 [Rasamsonia byssochlamydoides]|uniref:uncharacterized protein n=1 Tax=Rasamsonia byssochlamydoides TaxID=89139 RepID=UPI0037424C7B